ncbi:MULTISPECIES: hypothetical protein [unclassified Streptomyces]|nr:MULTISPECIES: hypothetical protein [unclassified Streptomyces]
MTQVDTIVLGFTVVAVALTVIGWMLSVRRRRHDRRVARGRRRARRT